MIGCQDIFPMASFSCIIIDLRVEYLIHAQALVMESKKQEFSAISGEQYPKAHFLGLGGRPRDVSVCLY